MKSKIKITLGIVAIILISIIVIFVMITKLIKIWKRNVIKLQKG